MLNDGFDFVPEMPDLDEELLPIIPLDHDTGMMTMRPYQQEAVDAVFSDLQEHRSTLAVLATGLGKAQPLDEPVLTPTGWRMMGDLEPLDYVIGRNGEPTPVIGVFPQGEKAIVCVTFSDGTSTRCCREHLWNVQTKSQKARRSGYETRTAADLQFDLLDGSGANKWFVPLVGPVQFEIQEVPIQPYLLGVLLGDGGLRHQMIVSSVDQFIIDSVREQLPAGHSIEHHDRCDWSIKSGELGCNGGQLHRALKELGCRGKYSYEKSIPEIYKYNTVAARIDLLRGLMDTDGECRESDAHAEFNTTSRQLADDVCEIVRSLGGATRVRRKAPGKYTHNGEKRTGRESFRVTVSLDGITPFSLPRKAQVCRHGKNQGQTKAIVSIEDCGFEDCQCISVAAEDGLYVTKDYIVTHNTIIFAEVAYRWPVGRVLIVAHREELIEQAQDKVGHHLDERPAIEMGSRKESRHGHGLLDKSKVLVTSVQTMSRPNRMQFFNPMDFGLVIVDECVVGETLVTLADGSQKPIQEIVESGKNVSIQTLNESTGLIEPRVVVGCKRSSAETICEVEVAGGVRLRCTTDHLVMTTIGYVRAGSLTQNHFVLNCRHNGTPTVTTCVRKPSRRCVDASSGRMYSPSIDGTALREANAARHGEVRATSGVGGDGAETVRKRRMGRVVDVVQYAQPTGVLGGLFGLLSLRGQAAINGLVESYRRARAVLVVHGRWFMHEGRCSDFDRRIRQAWPRDHGRMVSQAMGYCGGDLQIEEASAAPELQQAQRAVAQRSDSTVRHSVDVVQAVSRQVGDLPQLRRTIHDEKPQQHSLFQSRMPRDCRKNPVSQLLPEVKGADSCKDEGGFCRENEAENVPHLRRNIHDIQDKEGSLREDELQDCKTQSDGRRVVSNPQGWNIEQRQVVSVTREEITREVFDLWVDGNHNYFANGILVHNCHHATSASYRRVLEHFHKNPQLRHVGVTATPKRADEAALGDIYQSVAYEMDIREGIDEGWLVDVEQRFVVIEGLDFSEVRTTAGDFNQKDLAAVMMGSLQAERLMAEESPVHKIVSATIQEAQGRPTIIFCVTKAHAELTCEICQRHPGVTAEFVTDDTDAETRREIIKRFRAGTTQIFCNVGIATEGFDARVDVVAVARPTKSEALYRQMIGRGTRPLGGLVDRYDTANERREAIANSVKPAMTVLDFVGASGRHTLISAVDVLGGNYTEDIIEAAKRRLRESGETVDIDELLAEEALAAAERKAKAQKLAQEQKERDAAAKIRAEEERLKRQAEWNTRKGIRGHATYRTEAVSAFERVTIPEQVGIGIHRGGCSDGQVKFLMRLGVTEQEACKYSKGQAGVVIDKLSKQTGGDYIMPFTKHMGRKLRDIPSGYLDWAEKNISDPKIQAEIKRFRSQGHILAAVTVLTEGTTLSDEPTPF